MFIKINDSIYNLSQFCEIVPMEDDQIHFITPSNVKKIEYFDDPKDCKEKFAKIKKLLL